MLWDSVFHFPLLQQLYLSDSLSILHYTSEFEPEKVLKKSKSYHGIIFWILLSQ